MSAFSTVLGLTAETPIHAGASSANHVIDLPIMRERSTGWPVVFGSAVKGALRAKAELQGIEPQARYAFFGPDTQNASDHAGSLLITDARLLLLPVRSLTSQFRYVTSPDLLRRWLRDLERAGKALNISVPNPQGNTAVVTAECKHKDLFLEEYVFSTDGSQALDTLVQALAAISGRSVDEISQKLTIVHDDQFTLLCQAAIPVNAHIALDSATKTVTKGMLWYEESLPAETVLYVVVGAQNSRNRNYEKKADELLADFTLQLFGTQPYVQLGGNETTGMGWCKVQIQGGAQ